MKYTIYFVLSQIILCAGCTPSPADEVDTDQAAAIVAGQMAFYEPTEAGKPDVQTTCSKCKGTKKVRSGDDLALVPCPCGENCKCEKTGQAADKPELPNRMLMFTASWCGPCQIWKRDEKPEMEKAGWIISGRESAHIQTVDTDVQPDLTQRYGVTAIPVFIMVDPDGKEVASSLYMDAADTAAFYYANQESGQ